MRWCWTGCPTDAPPLVGICKTEVGDSLDLLLSELAALGLCQPDGTFVATLQDLRERLAEMTEVGEAVWVDGPATRVQCGSSQMRV